MLTMCRTLMGDPELVIIDEPTEGLAPKLVEQVATLLDEIARRGVSILLVEQKLTIALKISHRLYVMGHGRIVFEGTPADLAANAAVRKENLEVRGAAMKTPRKGFQQMVDEAKSRIKTISLEEAKRVSGATAWCSWTCVTCASWSARA